MPGQLRQGQHEPIVPMRDGQAPGWVVRCRDCDFAHDAHGTTAAEAVNAVRPTHAPGHFLYAQMVTYTDHPLYPKQ